MENPGCLVLPRAMSSKISEDTRQDIERDQHGQVVLSRADHDFIREKAEAAGTIRVPAAEYRFFDTAPSPIIRQNPARKARGRTTQMKGSAQRTLTARA